MSLVRDPSFLGVLRVLWWSAEVPAWFSYLSVMSPSVADAIGVNYALVDHGIPLSTGWAGTVADGASPHPRKCCPWRPLPPQVLEPR